MKEISIKNLAYFIKEAKDNNQPQPIFFLGAGASVTGNIPLAKELSKLILEQFKDNPFVKELKENERTYSKLMEAISPNNRNKLLKDIIDKAKINVTHIYLAQLLKEGYVDYVLTVNFDNLMLRALSLYNIFPPTYDMAILKEFTTTDFNQKSVVYLHGQHHGVWLLNTQYETEKVKSTVPRVFDSIKNGRPWIFIGYSGSDPIFEHIKGLGRFDNCLYWVGYNDTSLSNDVHNFLNNTNTNAFYIKGYDADAFMLKLNEELGLSQPEILDKPFTCLLNMLKNINDINDEKHFQGVRERLEMSKNHVGKAIKQFEENEKVNIEDDTLDIDKLKKQLINMIISGNYNEQQIKYIEEQANRINDEELNDLLSSYYLEWGNSLGNLAKSKKLLEAEVFYKEVFKKYEKALKIKPDMIEALNNWGVLLEEIGKNKEGIETNDLYEQAFEKFKKATEIKPNYHQAFFNWGISLANFAKTKESKEADVLYKQAFEKFQIAIEIKPNYHQAFYNWGTYLGVLAKTKEEKEADVLYKRAFEKFQKAIEIKPDFYEAYCNWGTILGNQAKTKEGKEAMILYRLAIDKYEEALKTNPNINVIVYDWGNYLVALANRTEGKEAEKLYYLAFEKYTEAIRINPYDYEVLNNWGNSLGNLAKTKEGKEAETFYNQAFEKYQKAIDIKPDFYEAYYNWGTNLINFAQTKEGKEANELYREAFIKYTEALKIKPDDYEVLENWGCYLVVLAKTKEGKEADDLFEQAFEKYQKAIELGGSCYNLSCLYAFKKLKNEALKYLDISLSKNEIPISVVLKDEDWKEYLEDEEFLKLIEKYKK